MAFLKIGILKCYDEEFTSWTPRHDIYEKRLQLLYNGLFVFLLLIFISGCVPSPSENANDPPIATDLHSFFTPQNTTQTYLWHNIPNANMKDSAYFLEYFGMNFQKTPEGILPISLFGFSDTLRKDSIFNEAYISDSLIRLYYGNATDLFIPEQILLRDTLRVGANWIAADSFPTKNGAKVSIKALVENYYAETSAGGNTYNDVYMVSYTALVKGVQIPLEPQYQNGSHLDIYFARNIGDMLEICKDSRDSTIFTNELIETRIR